MHIVCVWSHLTRHVPLLVLLLLQFNCGEAVNFACSDWLVAGGHAEERYRGFGRESVFSHQRLLFTLLHHRAELEHKCLKE